MAWRARSASSPAIVSTKASVPSDGALAGRVAAGDWLRGAGCVLVHPLPAASTSAAARHTHDGALIVSLDNTYLLWFSSHISPRSL